MQAEQYIEAHRDLSASHNCYAYKLGQEQRATDDGEPSGTAGQPILSAINAEDLNGICVLVTRCRLFLTHSKRKQRKGKKESKFYAMRHHNGSLCLKRQPGIHTSMRVICIMMLFLVKSR